MSLSVSRLWVIDNEESGGTSMHASLWQARRALRLRRTPAISGQNSFPVTMSAARPAEMPARDEAVLAGEGA